MYLLFQGGTELNLELQRGLAPRPLPGYGPVRSDMSGNKIAGTAF